MSTMDDLVAARVDALGDPLPEAAVARLGTVRFRTGGPIAQMAYAPDGRLLAAVGGHGLALFDPRDGRRLRALKGSDAGFGRVEFSARGDLVVASGAREVRLWETKGFTELRVIHEPHTRILALALAPDGERVFTAGQDRIGRVWEIATGKLLFELARPFNMHVASAAFSPDGRWIATAGPHDALDLWDASAGTHAHAFGDAGFMPCVVAFSPDGRRLLGGSAHGRALIWDPVLRVRRGALDAHPAEITSVRFSPDGTRFVTAGRDRKLRIWETRACAQVFEIDVLDEAGCVAIDPMSEEIAFGGESQVVHRYFVSTGVQRASPAGHHGAVSGLAERPDGARVVSVGVDGRALVWGLSEGNCIQEVQVSARGVMALRDDGAALIESDRKGSPVTLRIIDLDNGEVLASTDPDSASRVVCAPGDSRVALVTSYGAVRFLRPDLSDARGVSGDAEDLAWSRDGRVAVTRTRRNAMRVLDPDGLREVRRVSCAKVECMALSGDGAELYASGSTGVLRRWSIESGKELAHEKVWALSVVAMAISPDDALLALGTLNGHVLLCDPRSCAVLGEVSAHTGAVRALRFTRDAERLVSAGEDTVAMVWSVDALRGQTVSFYGRRPA